MQQSSRLGGGSIQPIWKWYFVKVRSAMLVSLSVIVHLGLGIVGGVFSGQYLTPDEYGMYGIPNSVKLHLPNIWQSTSPTWNFSPLKILIDITFHSKVKEYRFHVPIYHIFWELQLQHERWSKSPGLYPFSGSAMATPFIQSFIVRVIPKPFRTLPMSSRTLPKDCRTWPSQMKKRPQKFPNVFIDWRWLNFFVSYFRLLQKRRLKHVWTCILTGEFFSSVFSYQQFMFIWHTSSTLYSFQKLAMSVW
jgi:hypothetical protein